MLLGGSTFATAIGFVSSVLKARALGPESFGLLAVVIAYAGTVTILATFQPWQAVINFGARDLKKERHDRVVGTIKLGLLLDLIGMGIGTVICLLGAYFLMPHLGWLPGTVRLGAASTLLVVTAPLGTPLGVLRLLDRFRPLMVQQLLTSGLGLAGTVMVFALGGGVWEFLWVQIGSQCIGTVFVVLAAWREMKRHGFPSVWRTQIEKWRPMVRFSTWIFFQSSPGVAVRQLDVLIVGSVLSLEAAGIYKIVKQLLQAFGILTDPIYDASYPQFASLIAERRPMDATRHAVRLGAIILGSSAPVAIAVAATSQWWIPAVFGPGYSGATVPLAVFLGFAVVSGATNPVHPLFLSFGYAKLATLVSFIASSLYVALAIVWGRRFGLVGIGLAFGAANITASSLKAAYLTRHARPSASATDAHKV